MQQQYRQYPQNVPPHPQRSPHVPQPRRGGIGPMMSAGPVPGLPPNPRDIEVAQQRQAFLDQRAKLRSRKPVDKTMPEGVENVIIGDGVQRYRDLREFERHLDATMTRKRLDAVESTTRNGRRFKTMRIWINNTAEDQPWQNTETGAEGFTFDGTSSASFKVKIEGRLLDDDEQESEQGAGESSADDAMDTDEAKPTTTATPLSKPAETRFSHFFKAITVDFNGAMQRHGASHVVEWRKPDRPSNTPQQLPPAADFDEFTFKRSADENMNITINLFRHEEPERYQLSRPVAELVDSPTATKSEVVMAIWEHIKLNGLMEDDEKRNFRVDDALRPIFRSETGWIPGLSEYLNQHFKPLEPIKLNYTIRVDQEFQSNPQPTIYDIRVAVPDPVRNTLFQFIHNPAYVSMLKEVVGLDEKLAVMVQAIADSKSKHQFLTGIVSDPSNFTRDWMSSQKRDLEMIMGEGGARGAGAEDTAGDEWRRGGSGSVWASANAKESVNVILSKIPPPHVR